MKYKEVVFISFYNSFPITSGSSNVSSTFFLNCPIKKKTLYKFGTDKKRIYNYKIVNIFLKKETKFEKLKKISILLKKIFLSHNHSKKILFIFEGASSTIFTSLVYLLLKKKYKNSLFVYHGHNIDFDIRTNYFIKLITYFSEKYIYQSFNLATVVSKNDQLKIKKYYNSKSKIFENFVQDLKLKKKNIKKYIIFSGSLNFKYNLICFEKLINYYFPLILKVDKKFKLVVTGNKYIPHELNRSYIINKGDLKFDTYKKLLKDSFCSVYPFEKSPGTKVKIIESLYNKKITLTNKEGVKGIIANKKIILFKNTREFNQKFKYLYKNYTKVEKMYIKNSKNIIKQYDAKKKIRNFFRDLQS